MPVEHVETLIIGGGQAGLTMSHMLTKRGRPHLVVEKRRIAESWRSDRWDGLHFQAPNWNVTLPDFPFPHTDPNGYATHLQIADFIAAYAAFIAAPVRCGVAVTSLRWRQETSGFIAETAGNSIDATNVVVATGAFQRPVVPDILLETPGIVESCQTAPCWWWVPETPADRSPRNCCARGAAFSSRSASIAASPVITAAATCIGGWTCWARTRPRRKSGRRIARPWC
jgi:hypothetical protein